MKKASISFVSGSLVNTVGMTTGFIPLLLVVGLGSFVASRPLSLSDLQAETQEVADLKAIINTLLQNSVNEQTYQVPINSLGWSSASVKTQKFSDLLKKVGSALCGAVYNPSSLAQAMAQLDEMDEDEMEGFKSFLKRFGSNLCDYITDGNGGASEQASISGPSVPYYFYPRLQKQNVAELQGFLQVAKKIGSALCKAAYDGSDLNVLAEAISSWHKMDEAEIESMKDFFRRFGSNLCDYITKDNGDSERINKQDYAAINTYSWPNHKMEQSIEIQGFLSTARKIGSALCRAAYNGGNAVALPQSLGLTDEAQVQRFKDFLKRFGSNLCDYVTDGNGKTSSNQEVTSLVQSNAEAQGFFKKVADALCRAGYGDKNPTAAAELLGLSDEAEVQKITDFLKRFGSNLCDYVTNGNGRKSSINEQKLTSVAGWTILPNQDQDKSAEVEGLLSVTKKIGSALCRALDGNPSAMAESVISWGKMDQVEAESFKDLIKTFGSRVCDYITKGDGKVDTKKNELAQELIAIME